MHVDQAQRHHLHHPVQQQQRGGALFSDCATAPSNFFLSPTGTDLQKAFKQIGQELSTLRLSQ